MMHMDYTVIMLKAHSEYTVFVQGLRMNYEIIKHKLRRENSIFRRILPIYLAQITQELPRNYARIMHS